MAENIINAVTVDRGEASLIMVVGVGGGGGNAVNHMWNLGIKGVDFMVCNTDRQALSKSPVECKILLGHTGLGAGNDADKGREAAIESLDEVRHHLEASQTKMLFVAAGMGKGTGTGASPVIAKLAREMGILTVAIVTSPLAVEGPMRYEQACRGIQELKANVDSLLVINNESILEVYGNLSVKQAFGKADDVLAAAAKGIAEIITVESDLVNVDFADVSKVMRNSGKALMSVATAEGENRAEAVVEASLHSPLLDHNQIAGAKSILMNVSVCDADRLMLSEVNEIMNYIQRYASTQDSHGGMRRANIIWGTSEKPNLPEDALELMVVVTGFDDENAEPVQADTLAPDAPAPAEDTAGLVPLKPVKPQPARPQPPVGPVVLGGKSSRYKNIETLLSKPAYQTRNAKFIVEKPAGCKEVAKEDSTDRSQPQAPQQVLFD